MSEKQRVKVKNGEISTFRFLLVGSLLESESQQPFLIQQKHE
jgi:hypothetical protein